MPELQERLSELGADVRWPQTPDLAGRVRAAVAQEERAGAVSAGRGRLPGRAGRRAPRRPGAMSGRLPAGFARPPAAVLVAALLALAFVALLAAAPGVRSALLRTLGLEHATVTRVKRLPPATLGTRLALGDRVTFAAAQRRAAFALRRPSALGAPQEVYIDRGVVTFVYGRTPGRLILFQQAAGSAGAYVRKFAREFESVDVAGAQGLLVHGEHVTVFEQQAGGRREEPSRLAKTTLIWERNGLLMRLEGDVSDDELVAVAVSVR